MAKFIDLTGQKFGKWTVLSKERKNDRNEWIWKCECACENKTIGFLKSTVLLTSHSKSCGCFRKEFAVTHGHTYSKTYKIWEGIIQRCNNPNSTTYKRYGGCGIKVCDRWLKFENFLKDMGERPEGMTIDRYPNNQGNYEPGNCRWATNNQQARNKKTNINITFNNKTQCLKDWAREYNIPAYILWQRIRKLKWPIEKALLAPIESRKKILIAFNGKTQSLSGWAKEYKIEYATLYNRIFLHKWSMEDALLIPFEDKSFTIGVDKKTLVEWCKIYNTSYKLVWKRIFKSDWDIEEALTTPPLRGTDYNSIKLTGKYLERWNKCLSEMSEEERKEYEGMV